MYIKNLCKYIKDNNTCTNENVKTGFFSKCPHMNSPKDCIYFEMSPKPEIKSLKTNHDYKEAIKEALFLRRKVDRLLVEADPAGNSYDYVFTDKFKELAEIAEIDLTKYNPQDYQ